MTQLLRKLRRAVLNQDPSFCDMHEDPGSRATGEEYLALLRPHLPGRHLTILDAGCQAGRLLLPLAQDGHELIGVDTSGFALRRAAAHAKAQGRALRLHRGGIAGLRRWVPAGSCDAVVCTEVLYLCRDYRQLLRLLAESLKPRGLLAVSHRAAAYYTSVAIAKGQTEFASQLARRREGRSTDGEYHNWQTPDDLRALYRELGLSWRGCYPIREKRVALELKPADEAVKALLGPAADGGMFRIPEYWFVIAQAPA
ncbi:MAG: class I SAM-dependent methyltransferase [Candidatus Omnitrophica bacterium]|nr:class I SAM-dependent methyltransferase [Candidatus Omnitrophota bacterium]